jgi:hypothetical protein
MNICNVCLIKYYHCRSTCFHDPRASLIGNCLLYACTWANKTLLQSFLINRWHLLQSLHMIYGTPHKSFSGAPHNLLAGFTTENSSPSHLEVATSKSNKHHRLATRSPSATRYNLTMQRTRIALTRNRIALLQAQVS